MVARHPNRPTPLTHYRLVVSVSFLKTSERGPTVGNVRSTEAVPGETYALRSRPQIKVEMLETPAEVRLARRMRVRFLNGVKAGEVSDLPSVAIVPLPGAASPVRKSHLKPSSPVPTIARGPLRVGSTVILVSDKSGFRWTVTRLVPEDSVEITTTIFERRTRMTVSRDSVQLVGPSRRPPIRKAASLKLVESGDSDRAFDQSEWIAKNLRPIQPRRTLDIVIDSLVFSQRCLQSYRDRFHEGGSPSESADRLRQELRRSGVIERDKGRRGNYGRIRVPHRFDLVLPADFEPGVASTLDDPSCIVDRRYRREYRRRRPVERRRAA